MNNPEILIIDDEPQIRKLLSIVLESDGYRVWSANTGTDGISLAASRKPDMILLDLGLPDMSGFEVLKELKLWYLKPILIISVQKREEDIINALDLGADDYIIKPFRTGELLARTRTALRRQTTNTVNNNLSIGPITIDFEARSVFCNGIPLKLTTTEYHLLTLFVTNEGKVLTHVYLLKEVWGDAYQNQTQYLRVFVAQLRKKIEVNPNKPKYFLTESGIGYRFVSDNPS